MNLIKTEIENLDYCPICGANFRCDMISGPNSDDYSYIEYLYDCPECKKRIVEVYELRKLEVWEHEEDEIEGTDKSN